MREEVTTNLQCKITVDGKIVPFEHVADHSGSNHFGYLRRVHLAPKARLVPYPNLSSAARRCRAWLCLLKQCLLRANECAPNAEIWPRVPSGWGTRIRT